MHRRMADDREEICTISILQHQQVMDSTGCSNMYWQLLFYTSSTSFTITEDSSPHLIINCKIESLPRSSLTRRSKTTSAVIITPLGGFFFATRSFYWSFVCTLNHEMLYNEDDFEERSSVKSVQEITCNEVSTLLIYFFAITLFVVSHLFLVVECPLFKFKKVLLKIYCVYLTFRNICNLPLVDSCSISSSMCSFYIHTYFKDVQRMLYAL